MEELCVPGSPMAWQWEGEALSWCIIPHREDQDTQSDHEPCMSTHLLRSLGTEWDGRAREKGSHGAGLGVGGFQDDTVTGKLGQIEKGIPNRGDRQVLACKLETATIQRQELSDLIRSIEGKLARATSWLPCRGGWPSWKGTEAVGEAVLAASENTTSTVGP